MDTISHDPAFDGLVSANARLARLATGFAWAEGPVWFAEHNALLFSDIPNDRMLRWTPGALGEGTLSTFRAPAGHTNGHTRDREGRLVSCEHGGRRVSRTEPDGRVVTLADSYEGKRLNSPNDAVVARDGSIWFTDPPYGIWSDHEGHRAEQEQPCRVYRLDPSGELRAMVEDMSAPNGLAFSPDEGRLYVADTGHPAEPDAARHVRAFDWDGERLSGGEVLFEVDPGFVDGMRVDTTGRIWASAGDGVHVLTPEGRLLGRVPVPETVANVAWGGRERHVLYVTATTSLYAIPTTVNGMPYPFA